MANASVRRIYPRSRANQLPVEMMQRTPDHLVFSGERPALDYLDLSELDPAVRGFLAQEAARCGVEQAAVVTFALGLLAHYRSQTADGSSVLLGPPGSPASSPITFEATTASIAPVRLAALLGPPTYEFRMGGFNVATVQLQVVRDGDD